MFLKKSYKNPTLLIDGDLYLYRATTSIEEGVAKFVQWYKEYYEVN